MVYWPFTTSLIGSMPRSEELMEAREKQGESQQSKRNYQHILKKETEKVVRFQEDLGLDFIVSGELDRNNYMSYVAQHVSGIELMTMEEILEVTSSKDSFEESLEKMNASGSDISNPVAVNKIDTEAVLDQAEIAMVQAITDKPIKATLPSPYLLTRSCWLEEITGKVYEDRRSLGQDIVNLLINEIRRLASMGVGMIQLDEPIFSEVVFTSSDNKDASFY